MSTFTTPLIVSPHEDGKHWIIGSPFIYYVGEYLESNDIVIVPKGYSTDFASVPRFLWNIFPPWGKYGKAAVVHDWLCDIKDRPSKEVHKIFLEAMAVLKVPRWKRNIMYFGVKMFGPKFDGPMKSG